MPLGDAVQGQAHALPFQTHPVATGVHGLGIHQGQGLAQVALGQLQLAFGIAAALQQAHQGQDSGIEGTAGQMADAVGPLPDIEQLGRHVTQAALAVEHAQGGRRVMPG